MKVQQLIERAKLAWSILRSTDCNLVAHAHTEFEVAGYGDGDNMNRMMAAGVVDLVRVFSAQGHSGFSASFCRQLFDKVAAFKPIGPLTGADSEWFDHGDMMGDTRWQNKRCGHVFKNADGTTYDIDAVVFEELNGSRFTSFRSRRPVTFPYAPRSVVAKIPDDASDADMESAATLAWAAA